MFAGIGGFDLGFERAGFDVVWCIEWDRNAQAVLRKRFPKATVYGDIREIDPDKLERVDVVCGGFPCQDLSVAGKRAGLAGERSGLFHDAMRLVRRLRPSVLVLENVPGLLSSNRGLDFATVLREVGEGWDCAEVGWRVLDSQYFGVAQRRRRVFVVGGTRVGCAEQVLALAEGCGGNPPSRDTARKGTSSDAAGGPGIPGIVPALTSKMAKGTGGPSGDECQNLIVGTIDCNIARQSVQNFVAGHIGIGSKYDPSYTLDRTGSQSVAFTIDMQACKGNANIGDGSVCPTLCRPSGNDVHAVAFTGTSHAQYGEGIGTLRAHGGDLGGGSETLIAYRKSKRAQTEDDDETWVNDGLANTLNGFNTGDTRTTHAVAHAFYSTGGARGLNRIPELCPTLKNGSGIGILSPRAVCTSTIVRRLTPVECERLQGFPDGWTQIGTQDKPTADTHRYKQLGNAVTVNVAEWIARRALAHLSKER